MCGVPHRAVNNYIDILIDKGYKAAICEQMEDPEKAKEWLKRAVTRFNYIPGNANGFKMVNRHVMLTIILQRLVDKMGYLVLPIPTYRLGSLKRQA